MMSPSRKEDDMRTITRDARSNMIAVAVDGSHESRHALDVDAADIARKRPADCQG